MSSPLCLCQRSLVTSKIPSGSGPRCSRCKEPSDSPLLGTSGVSLPLFVYESLLGSVCTTTVVTLQHTEVFSPSWETRPIVSVSGKLNGALGCRNLAVKRLSRSPGGRICVFLPALAPGLRQCLLCGEGEREVSPGPRWPAGQPCY